MLKNISMKTGRSILSGDRPVVTVFELVGQYSPTVSEWEWR